MFRVPEHNRYQQKGLPRTVRGDNRGMFIVDAGRGRPYALRIMASDGFGWEHVYEPPVWEHVSVSTTVRCPTWEEMAMVKDMFWDPEDLVLQFHPPRSVYVNSHPYCLHLWRPVGVSIPLPPSQTVG